MHLSLSMGFIPSKLNVQGAGGHDYAHTQTVETKLFSPPSLRPGNEARQESNLRLTAYKLIMHNYSM